MKNKAICKAHFQLMDETRTRFNEKQKAKEVRKTEAEKAKKEKDHAAAIPDGFAKGVNKKKTFDTDAADEDVSGAVSDAVHLVDQFLEFCQQRAGTAACRWSTDGDFWAFCRQFSLAVPSSGSQLKANTSGLSAY